MSTLLEAARVLAEDRFGFCPVCFERLWPMMSAPMGAPERVRGSHRPDCPWLALPQIVAVLEAAQTLVDSHPDPRQWGYAPMPGDADRKQAALLALFDALKPRPVTPVQRR